MNMLFAETLRKLRSEKGLSQRELAEQVYDALYYVTPDNQFYREPWHPLLMAAMVLPMLINIIGVLKRRSQKATASALRPPTIRSRISRWRTYGSGCRCKAANLRYSPAKEAEP